MIHIPVEIWVVIIGALITLIAFLLNRSLFKKMDDMSLEIKKSTKEQQDFRELVIKDYVQKVELRPNEMAHREIWQEVNNVRERIAKLEGKDQ